MSMKKLHIACSPLSGNIFAGTLLKNETIWSANKQDLTLEAVIAVAEHVNRFGGEIKVTRDDDTVEFS